MRNLLKPLQAQVFPNALGKRNRFNLLHHSPKKKQLYLIDAHSAQGFAFSRKKGEFHYLGSPNYGNFDNEGKPCVGLYSKKGWDSRKLPLTGFQPLLDEAEAETLQKEIQTTIANSKPGARFGIEAIDCILTIANAKWLVKLKQEYNVAIKAQLTYNHQNHLATGCRTWDEKEQRYAGTGMSPLGKEIAGILMQGGIILDASHLNKQSLLDACAIGRALGKPVIASHSNTLQVFAQGEEQTSLKAADRFAVRCLDDEEISAVLATGGYVGLTPSPWFLSIESSRWMANIWNGNPFKTGGNKKELRVQATELLISHISHVRQVALQAGFDMRSSAALASDIERMADGKAAMPRGFSERSYKNLFSSLAGALADKGWHEEDIDALFHGNVERIFQ